MTKQPFDPAKLSAILKDILAFSPPDENDARAIKQEPKQQRAFLKRLRHAVEFLANVECSIDEILSPPHVFSLNNPNTIGEVIAYKLEQLPASPLDSISKFYGSGVYSFYYLGTYEAYRPIQNTACPIYVGSAGAMIANADTPRLQGLKLFSRINEHLTRSIAKSRNLTPSEFSCRYLVVQSGLEKAAEDFLIKMYLPVWNKESKVCAGIGKHGYKARRELSDWDILHGGRKWAEGQRSLAGMTEATIQRHIAQHFSDLLAKDPIRWRRILNQQWLEKPNS